MKKKHLELFDNNTNLGKIRKKNHLQPKNIS